MKGTKVIAFVEQIGAKSKVRLTAKRSWFLIGILLACSGFFANAGTVQEIQGQAQPTFEFDKSRYSGCGVRLIGIQTPSSGIQRFIGIDSSVNLLESLGFRGAAKAFVFTISAQDYMSTKIDRQSPVDIRSFWFKTGDREATAPVGGEILGSKGGAKLYVTSTESALSILDAVMRNASITFGYELPGGEMQAFHGKFNLSQSGNEQLFQCISDLAREPNKGAIPDK